MRINHELLDLTMAQITSCKARWDQGNWYRLRPRSKCGTAFCFAGWVCILTGDPPPTEGDYESWPILGQGNAEERARSRLGLLNGEVADLFDGRNDLRTLRRIVKELHAKEGYVAQTANR